MQKKKNSHEKLEKFVEKNCDAFFRFFFLLDWDVRGFRGNFEFLGWIVLA
jgi:hypothetical protein